MRILITGGTGSLGKALTRHILNSPDYIKHEVCVYSRDEAKMAAFPYEVCKIVGDVRDKDRLDYTFNRFKPNIVFHAAALKRVDDMELYPDECLKTNINGSQNVAWACDKHQIKKCVFVSTDKACQPANIYGATKFCAERLFSNYNQHSDTIFCSCRYGNVISSRGSFIPLWIDKIKNGEVIEITDNECSRFLFTLNDAVKFVTTIERNIGYGGEVFVPLMHSYKITDVVKALERITGKIASTKVIGMRPGEKLHEDMVAPTERNRCFIRDQLDILAIYPEYYETYQGFFTEKYNGKDVNSANFVNTNIDDLVNLILRGLKESQ